MTISRLSSLLTVLWPRSLILPFHAKRGALADGEALPYSNQARHSASVNKLSCSAFVSSTGMLQALARASAATSEGNGRQLEALADHI